jgi:hypothetical protein
MMSDFLYALLVDYGWKGVGGGGGVLCALMSQRSLSPVPIALVLFPFANMRDVSMLARFSSFGIASVVICIAFIR